MRKHFPLKKKESSQEKDIVSKKEQKEEPEAHSVCIVVAEKAKRVMTMEGEEKLEGRKSPPKTRLNDTGTNMEDNQNIVGTQTLIEMLLGESEEQRPKLQRS